MKGGMGEFPHLPRKSETAGKRRHENKENSGALKSILVKGSCHWRREYPAELKALTETRCPHLPNRRRSSFRTSCRTGPL